MMQLNARLVILTAVLAVGQAASAQETTFSLGPENTTVNFTVEATLHTVHGTFRLKSGTIRFDPSTGAGGGIVVIDAASGQTGNRKRDRNMHRDVLMSERYPEITFTPKRVIGTVSLQGESSVQVEGILRLLGTDHPITLPFRVQASGSELRATTQLIVPYVSWGLKNPSTFFLHVADTVEVSIAASGQLATATAQR